jgi:hypothetical protein
MPQDIPGRKPDAGSPKPAAPPVRPDPKIRPAHTPAEDEEHEGGTEKQIGDLTGPGAGYDDEPEKVDNDSGVA